MKPTDYPREEILKKAIQALEQFPGAKVYFKFTCSHCGERCTFQEPNMLYESGECCKCGKDSPVTMAGFSLEMKL